MTTAYVGLPNGLVVADGVESPPDATGSLRLPEPRVESVAVSPSAPERVFAGTFDAGLWRSTDAGETFNRVGDAIEPAAVTAAAVSPHDPDTLLVGTEPSRIYRSDDGGESWERLEGLSELPSAGEWSFPPRPQTHHVRWIQPSHADRGTWYVGIEAGAFVVTRDGGETWRDRPPGALLDNHTIATHPDAPDRVYSAAGDGYAESEDAGRTWQRPLDGLEHRYCWGLAVDPGDPDSVLVSAAHGARAAHGTGPSYLYRKRSDRDGASSVEVDGSSDGAASAWERLDDVDLPTGEGTRRAILASGTASGEVYAACDDGLYRTTDAGDTWIRCNVDSRGEINWQGRVERGPVRSLVVV